MFFDLTIEYFAILKLTTMQLVTRCGNHYCLMATDVQNSRLVHSFINIKGISTVYEYDKQKTIVY